MPPPDPGRPVPPAPPGSIVEHLSALWDLVRRYVLQETVEPLKGVARALAKGLAAAVLTGFAVVLLSLSALRALQTETGDAFDGNWSFVPYLIVLVGLAVVLAVALAVAQRREQRRA